MSAYPYESIVPNYSNLANEDGSVGRYSSEVSRAGGIDVPSQPGRSSLSEDPHYLLEADRMAPRMLTEVRGVDEPQWVGEQSQDLAYNFLRLVTLATTEGRLDATPPMDVRHGAAPLLCDPILRDPPPIRRDLTSSELGSRPNSEGSREIATVAPPGCHRTLTLGMRAQAVDLDDLANLREDRTTLMMKRVPRKYSLALLREEIASFPGLSDSYDLLYLPADVSKNANRGYAFINLKSISHVYIFASMLQNHEWRHYNASHRTCQLRFSHVQGREDTLQHLTQERHPLYTLQQRRRRQNYGAGAELVLLPVGSQDEWAADEYQLPNEDFFQPSYSTM